MEVQLRDSGSEHTGQAEIEITDEPGELHHVVIGVAWDTTGSTVIIHIDEDRSDDAPGLTFRGELDGEHRIVGRLIGWGIENARFTLVRR